MALQYTFNEQTDMILVLGYCQGNCLASVREYSQRYPNRRLPNHKTFAEIKGRLREIGQFTPQKADNGRERTTRTPDFEEQVLDMVTVDPALSTRRLGFQKIVYTGF